VEDRRNFATGVQRALSQHSDPLIEELTDLLRRAKEQQRALDVVLSNAEALAKRIAASSAEAMKRKPE
jgi:hypothetical protein